MRLRFSIRWLLIATAVVAAICCWLVYPTIIANRFIAALEAEDYSRADACFVNSADRTLAAWNDKHWKFRASARLESQTLRQFLRGQRLVTLTISRGDATVRTEHCTVVATRRGLLTPIVTGGRSGYVIAAVRDFTDNFIGPRNQTLHA